MTHQSIIIQGTPIAKKRPRFVRRGKYVGAYNCQETEEGRWILDAKQAITEKAEAGTPVALKCWFYFDFPKSMSKKKHREAVHTSKPDLDNLVKFVKDCLNGIAWHDDSQVVSIMAKKLYDYEGGGARSEIIITAEKTIKTGF
jgi:Holliday junction resolvase RusA-like endonuclease